MPTCCGKKEANPQQTDPCCPPEPSGGPQAATGPFAWFEQMVPNNLAYAKAQKAKGRRLVGIMCEYTPREVIMAAGAMPVCLCGGDVSTIPAAEETLPANLCPLIKSTYGFSVQNSNPFLDLMDLVVAETTCDGKKKMYELLAERHPMHVLELTQKPNDAAAFEHWYRELAGLKEKLEEQFNLTIQDACLEKAIKTMNRERRLRRELAGLMKADKPPLTGRELLDLKSLISGIPADFEMYRKALKELEGRELDPPADKRTRVLLTGVPLPHGAERVIDIIEENGGLVVVQENCTGLKPIYEDVTEESGDPLRAIAGKYFHLPCSVMTANTDRFGLIRDLAAEYRADCIIELTWQTCITYDIESHYVRRLAEETLDLPYLKIETDYSPNDSARIAMRVQALFETVRNR